MPTYVTIPESSAVETVTDSFGGYNHNFKINDGEFYDMQNLTSDYYPLLGNRDARSIIAAGEFTSIYGMIADADANLYVVAKTSASEGNAALYKIYRGTGTYAVIKKIVLTVDGTADSSATIAASNKQMMFFSNKIVIYPDKLSIKGESGTVTETTENHEYERLYKEISVTATSSAPIKFTPCDEDGESVTFTKSATAPAAPKTGDLWLDSSNAEALVWKKYIAGSWAKTSDIKSRVVLPMGTMSEKEIERKISIDSGDTIEISFTDATFSEGDNSAKFEGAHTPYKRVIHKTDETTSDSGVKSYTVELIYVFTDIITGEFTQTAGSIKLYRDAPDLDFVVQAQNRIWGCRYSYDATEAAAKTNVNEIYACKLGDETRWSTYKGIATDAYRASIGTPGAFTGAANIGGNLIFFKENCYHKVYVSSAGAHQIVDKTVQGVQMGCSGSIAVINDTCYYKARGGVMAFDGSQAYDIGAPLGDVYYVAAEGGSANDKYYLSLKDTAGVWSLFVYDTKRGLWHKEDEKHALAFFSINNETFFVTEGADGCSINLVSNYTKTGNAEPEFEWEAVTGLQGYNYTGQKYISRFNLRMMLPKGSEMHIYIEYDSSGVWEHQGRIKGRGTTSFMVPVKPKRCDHFRIKLTGHGTVRLYSFSKLFEGGTDVK